MGQKSANRCLPLPDLIYLTVRVSQDNIFYSELFKSVLTSLFAEAVTGETPWLMVGEKTRLLKCANGESWACIYGDPGNMSDKILMPDTQVNAVQKI